MYLVILGPPGGGKGTQAKRLVENYHIVQISTGEIIRKEVKEKTLLGNKVSSFINRGELVPDSIIIEIMKERLKKEDVLDGFVLDGFPRTLKQAIFLDRILGKMSLGLDCAIDIEVSYETLIRRLSGRRVCYECGFEYHLEFRRPIIFGICDNCKGRLYRREDDKEEVIQERLKIYRSEILPVIDYYESRGILFKIDGEGKPERIFSKIVDRLGKVL